MPAPLIIWIWFCAYLNSAGWLLSAIHQLNVGGYAIGLAFAGGLFTWWARKNRVFILPTGAGWKKWARRFRRPFPAGFLALTALAFLGGVIYPPTNYDALAYRLPRVLAWLQAEQWHWIPTIFDRLNNRSCGMEWVSAPFLLFLKTDRLLFLINIISFLLLPGLVFSLFTRLGVKSRVAWCWMWLVPGGYCFVLQAGSIGNDLFGTLFALAAVDLALRGAQKKNAVLVMTSIVAAALMTAAKTNNLPLLLPWAVAMLPSLMILLRRPVCTAVICLAAAGASGLPTIWFNLKHSGDWSGARLNTGKVEHAIFYRTTANVVALGQQNLVPPVFPAAERWNQVMKGHLPADVKCKLEAMIEVPGCWLPVVQMQMEENAGLGFGLSVLILVSLLAGIRLRPAGRKPELKFSLPALVRWSAAVAFLALLTQSNITAIGRLFAAYYVLPMAIILIGSGQPQLVRHGWWRRLAGGTFVLAAALLVISPARPLFPRDTLLGWLDARAENSKFLKRVEDVYLVYRERNRAFAPVLAKLPPDTKILGYAGYDKPETSLWQPLGSRSVTQISPGDTAAELRACGVRYLLVNPEGFEAYFNQPFSAWQASMNAVVVESIPLRLRAAEPPANWPLLRLESPN